MMILIAIVATWLFLGWKVGLALAAGVCLEFAEAAVLWRALLKSGRENADLVKLARAESYLGRDS